MTKDVVVRRYLFKLYPSEAQCDELHRQRLMMGDLWNALIQRNEDVSRRTYGGKGVRHADGKTLLTFFDMTKEITALRHECPEWAALSVWSAHRVAKSVELAYQAFFRRAKHGAGKEAGYPRYRRRDMASAVPHRFQSGCKFLPHDRERSGSARQTRSARTWILELKGVPGRIRAKGEFPVELGRLHGDGGAGSDADVIFRDGKWWLSACVEMQPRREKGKEKVTVRFDLIDEFACVERATGRRTPEAGSARAHVQNPNVSPRLR